MKKLTALLSLLFFATGLTMAQSTDQKLNLPGDNLNLYAVLKVFQESETLEKFEQKINEKDSKINNLDLNGDNKIDYIKVIDKIDGDAHNIVLQVPVNATENQDVAVIVVQKNKDGQVQIQVIGDEDLYGKDYIIEPNFDTEDNKTASTPNPGYTMGGTTPVQVERTTTYVIASWPIVQYVYMPGYNPWYSPWYWNYYPSYWSSWEPWYWHEYYGWHYHWNYYYFGHYRRWDHCRYNNWYGFYYGGKRARSNFYYERRERGAFKATYSRPDLLRKGSDEFRKKHPTAKSANDKLPKLDENGVKQPRRRDQIRPNNQPIKEKEVRERPDKIKNIERDRPTKDIKEQNIERPVKNQFPSEQPSRRNENREIERAQPKETKPERSAPSHESNGNNRGQKSGRKG